MKLFDLHGDIGYSVLQERKKNTVHPLLNIHVPKRKLGGFSWICMASYFEGSETWTEMQTMILALKEEIATCDEVTLVNSKETLLQKDKIKAILSVEGMCGIQKDVVASIDWLHDQGIQIASLTWNDENALATGARGNNKRGLSELGIQAVKQMEKNNMIIDVSHANEATFWDILHHTQGSVIATHSNARSLCEHVRNLKDEQLIEIAKRKGLIGIVTAGFFVAKERDKQDIVHLVKHIQYLKELIGIEHISFGFDFMDDFEGGEEDMLIDLKKVADAQRVLDEMRHQGFQEDEIRKVAYENAVTFLKRHFEK